MYIELRGYKYKCNVNGNHLKINIKNINREELEFFKNWAERIRNFGKSDYVRNIQYETETEKGYLSNCYPIISIHGYVMIYFDCRCAGPSNEVYYMEYTYDNKSNKPPIGLKPKFLYEQRFLEVCSFISRYYNSGQQIPIEWINEYNQLVINVGNNKQNKV